MAGPNDIANTLFKANSNVIQEKIGTSTREFMSPTDPIFREMILSPAKVEGGQEIGRDLLIKQRFYGSLAGVIEGGNMRDYFTLVGDTTDSAVDNFAKRFMVNTPSQAWPSPFGGANPKGFGFTCTLYSVLTNLALSLSMLRLEATEANIKQHVVPLLKGWARNMALWAANQFYGDPANGYRLGTLDAAAKLNNTNRTITFSPTEKTTARFAVGQSIDVFTSTTRENEASGSRIRGFVGMVDDWENTVVLVFDSKREDGTAVTLSSKADDSTVDATGTGWADSINTTGSYVTYANTYKSGFKGLYSWRHWIKWAKTTAQADTTILGDDAITTTSDDYIDVRKHNEFKSGHFGSVGPLTERSFLAYISRIHTAFNRHGYRVDDFIGSEGLWLNVFESRIAKEEVERGDTPGSIRNIGLEDGFGINHEGKKYRGFTSRFLEDGLILGLRTKGNWRMITPAMPKGVNRASLPEQESKIPHVFVAKALGWSSDVIPYLDPTSNMPTEFTFMPGYINMQMTPTEQIPGVLFEGVDTTRVYANK